jgi:hypothetical protein
MHWTRFKVFLLENREVKHACDVVKIVEEIGNAVVTLSSE